MVKKLGYGPRYWLYEDEREALRAEYTEKLRELDALPRTDWHAAFGAALDLMTFTADHVIITPEYELGVAPPRADFLVLLNDGLPLAGDVFKRFKKFNVLEYKSPEDSLNNRTIHKVLGYAHSFIGNAEREGMVPEDEVTAAIFRATKNQELFESLESIGALVQGDASGVYYLTKEVSTLPCQIVITSELEGDENRYWRALTDQTTKSDFERIIKDVYALRHEPLAACGRFYLELITRKNHKLVTEMREKGEEAMYDALMEIVSDRVDAKVDEAKRMTNAECIKNLTKNSGWPVEQAMDMLGIPASQWDEYYMLVSSM